MELLVTDCGYIILVLENKRILMILISRKVCDYINFICRIIHNFKFNYISSFFWNDQALCLIIVFFLLCRPIHFPSTDERYSIIITLLGCVLIGSPVQLGTPALPTTCPPVELAQVWLAQVAAIVCQLKIPFSSESMKKFIADYVCLLSRWCWPLDTLHLL